MGFDSTAELLFKINANADDAQGNIQRFRGMMSKDFSAMGAEAEDWAKKTFGALNSIQGLATAGAASMAAGVVAAAAKMHEATDQYAEYVGEVAKGVKVTGAAAEEISKLRFAAKMTGTDWDALTRGLALFASQAATAARSTDYQSTAFAKLRISQKDVQAGETEMLPLLMQVMDGFKGLHGGISKTAEARELFSRQGTELLTFLSLGTDGLRAMGDEAQRLGLVFNKADLTAVKEFKAEMRELRLEEEALNIEIGRRGLGVSHMFDLGKIGFIEALKASGGNFTAFFALWGAQMDMAEARIKNLAKATAAMENGPGLAHPEPKANAEGKPKAESDFRALSELLDQVTAKSAGLTSEEAKAAQEIVHLQNELDKAADAFIKVQQEGTITGEALEREAGRMAALPAAIERLQGQLATGIEDKRRTALEETTRDLTSRLESEQEQTFASRQRAFAREMDQLWTQLGLKDALTAQNVALLEEIESAGLAKIGRERSDAYRQELVDLQQYLAQIVSARMTTAERLAFQYQQDLQRYSQIQEQKALSTAKSEAESEIIRLQYATNRDALLQQYGFSLTALQNSEGWEGVFGSRFAQLLQHDQEALREWSESADQAFNLVRQSAVALEGLGRKAFDSFAQGMGQNIASAIVYKKSIGEAMRAALASTLEAIAAESLIQAIYASAIGFMRLAQHDYPAAGSAFTAAALFGSVGVAAAVAGRAIAPSQSGAGASAAGADRAIGAGSSGAQDGSNPQQGPHVTINLNGHVYGRSGIEEVCELINEYVGEADGYLLSSQTKQRSLLVPGA